MKLRSSPGSSGGSPGRAVAVIASCSVSASLFRCENGLPPPPPDGVGLGSLRGSRGELAGLGEPEGRNRL